MVKKPKYLTEARVKTKHKPIEPSVRTRAVMKLVYSFGYKKKLMYNREDNRYKLKGGEHRDNYTVNYNEEYSNEMASGDKMVTSPMYYIDNMEMRAVKTGIDYSSQEEVENNLFGPTFKLERWPQGIESYE
jgi:hypothetical protein